MIDLFDSYITEHGLLDGAGRVLCAVSGGADSMCLLTLMTEYCGGRGIDVCCAHFNHCLRGAESDRDEAFVRDFCAAQGIAFYAGRGDVNAFAAERGLGTEEAARLLRYAFLEQAAADSGADVTATAHTADDNAETVLFNLSRGSGLNGLCGIPPRRGAIIRPMLSMTRTDVLRVLRERGVSFVEDSTNAGDDYTRNRLRHHVAPVLREINPEFSRAVARMSRLLREDAEYLDSLAAEFIAGNETEGSLPTHKLRGLPTPVLSRVLRQMCPGIPEKKHIDGLLELCRRGAGSADVPGMRVTASADRLYFGGVPEPVGFEPFQLAPGETRRIPESGLRVSLSEGICANAAHINSSFNIFFFKCESICGKMTIRPRAEGDKMRLAGRGCSKTLRKLYTEKGVDALRRGLLPVAADELGPVAVYGLAQAERTLAAQGQPALILSFDEDK